MPSIINGIYRISVEPSIFTNRPGKTDIRIGEESSWGGRDNNGKRYMTSLVMDAETCATVRGYRLVPEDIIQTAKVFAAFVSAANSF